MDVTYQTKRISDMAGAMRLARELIGHDHWSAEELAAWQRRRLDQVVRYATAASPFYRERAGLDPGTPVQLPRLPVVDKATVMEHFDDLVTDPRLTLAAVEAHLDGLDRDELLLLAGTGPWPPAGAPAARACSSPTRTSGASTWPASSAGTIT